MASGVDSKSIGFANNPFLQQMGRRKSSTSKSIAPGKDKPAASSASDKVTKATVTPKAKTTTVSKPKPAASKPTTSTSTKPAISATSTTAKETVKPSSTATATSKPKTSTSSTSKVSSIASAFANKGVVYGQQRSSVTKPFKSASPATTSTKATENDTTFEKPAIRRRKGKKHARVVVDIDEDEDTAQDSLFAADSKTVETQNSDDRDNDDSKQLQQEIERLKQQNQQHLQTIQARDKTVGEQEKTIKELKQQLESMQNEMQAKDDRIAALLNEKKTLEADRNASLDQLDDVKLLYQVKERELEITMKENDGLKERLKQFAEQTSEVVAKRDEEEETEEQSKPSQLEEQETTQSNVSEADDEQEKEVENPLVGPSLDESLWDVDKEAEQEDGSDDKEKDAEKAEIETKTDDEDTEPVDLRVNTEKQLVVPPSEQESKKEEESTEQNETEQADEEDEEAEEATKGIFDDLVGDQNDAEDDTIFGNKQTIFDEADTPKAEQTESSIKKDDAKSVETKVENELDAESVEVDPLQSNNNGIDDKEAKEEQDAASQDSPLPDIEDPNEDIFGATKQLQSKEDEIDNLFESKKDAEPEKKAAVTKKKSGFFGGMDEFNEMFGDDDEDENQGDDIFGFKKQEKQRQQEQTKAKKMKSSLFDSDDDDMDALFAIEKEAQNLANNDTINID